jgi:hypothetical protein
VLKGFWADAGESIDHYMTVNQLRRQALAAANAGRGGSVRILGHGRRGLHRSNFVRYVLTHTDDEVSSSSTSSPTPAIPPTSRMSP